MSGEHAFLPAVSVAAASREVPEAMPAANPAKVAALRSLVDDLDLMAASREVDITALRAARNELAEIADALEQGGGVVEGFAVVPLVEAGTCRICGCTEDNACLGVVREPGMHISGARNCAWADDTATLCDNPDCIAKAGQP